MNRAEYEKDLFERVLSSMKRHGLESKADSVILTGSFGRDEATYENTADGVKLKSDVEIGIVFKCGKKEAYDFMGKVSAEFSEDLNLMPLDRYRIKHACNFNGGVFTPEKKTVFTYDLFCGSKTLWGRNYLEKHKLTPDMLDRFEAKRIVANRIGELVYLSQQGSENEDIWKAKLLLALASAILICGGKYVSSYHAQRDIVEKLAVDEIMGVGFKDDYTAAFAFLREGGERRDFSYDALRKYVGNACEFFDSVGIKKPHVNSFTRSLKYFLKYVRRYGLSGCVGLERKILSALILKFADNDKNIAKTAEMWHNVIY